MWLTKASMWDRDSLEKVSISRLGKVMKMVEEKL
jgi:hypothetical protein